MVGSPHEHLLQQAHLVAERYSESELLSLFTQPLVILSAPRSGSTLLFETLLKSPDLWSIKSESHFIFNAFPQLHPAQRGFASGALGAADADPELCHLMRACFLVLLRDVNGRRYLELAPSQRPRRLTLLEKTPRNALNIPFLTQLFPDLRAIFLHRDPRETVASIMEAWETGLSKGGFVTFPNLPGWDRQHWCLLLPPGWRALNGKSLAEIATFQWMAANSAILKDLQTLPQTRWLSVSYRALVTEPGTTLRRIAEFAAIPFEGPLDNCTRQALPLSSTTLSRPQADKWRRHGAQIEALADQYSELAQTLAAL